MEPRLTGHVAVVTGASRGAGRGIATALDGRQPPAYQIKGKDASD